MELTTSQLQNSLHLSPFILAWAVLFPVSAEPAAPPVHSIKTDSDSLLAFKRMIQRDPDGALSGWQQRADPCSWHGVKCSSGRVNSLDLSQAGILGDFSFSPFSSLDMLDSLDVSGNRGLWLNFSSLVDGLPSSLKKLDLSFSGLTGNVPENLFVQCPNLQFVNVAFTGISGTLHDSFLIGADNLQVLDMSYNNLTGSISGMEIGACDSLSRLDFSGNRFSGSVPAAFANCTHLSEMNLASNLFSGQIPEQFGQLRGMQRLDFSSNLLSGWIPTELGNVCGSLWELKLSNNNLTGPVPDSFSSCSLLQNLDLSGNNLTGSFPDSFFEKMASLETLIVSSNMISGDFPVSLSFCEKLRVIDFSSNLISGVVPPDLCPRAGSLEELRAADNLLSGAIPGQLSKCTQLRTIDLSLNNLNGSVPPELGSLGNLEQLIAWYNNLAGNIPPELGNCGKLQGLILNNNNLTGKLPPELFNCRDLEWVALTSNGLTGQIPGEFGSLKRLAILQLGNNSLTGEIPPELGNSSSLVWLDLSSNGLVGEIPPRLGRQKGAKASRDGIFSGNTMVFVRNVGSSCRGVGGLLEFSGIRPEKLLKVPSLRSCDFTRLYSGPVLSFFTTYQTLEYLDLSYNSLRGEIPREFGEMIELQVLVLSHNRISGEIPPSFGRLKNLGVFEASHNMLQGQIPDSFSNLSFLVQIDLSDNELTGEIPQRGQLSTLPATQFANNPGLCGVPLAQCGTPIATTNPSSRGRRSRTNSREITAVVIGMGISFATILAFLVLALVVRSRLREAKEIKILNSLNASQAATTWKIEREKEPLSINVATFQMQLKKLKFSQLIEATNGFATASLIGTGGFGEVFKATLKDGSTVAIKKLISFSCQGDREFMAEMETLGKIRHKNLVPLLGYCKVGEERLLVYEFMKNGNLDEALHARASTLTWEERKKIARGAAKGLCFLHHNCIPHIIHRDMKSSNVLLNDDLEARVSDFGMARLISALDTHLSVSTLAGTPGYVPPEYYQSFRCTAKGDVYSFGVILLELLTGRRPTDKEDFGDTNLVGWVKMKVREGKAMEVIDPGLISVAAKGTDESEWGEVKEMIRYLEITLQCVEDFPSKRPNILQVVAMLRELLMPGSSGTSSSSA
ncbi:hypothetical protein DM860_011466 [Cuscuta australis]|uniref:non-specific serine/threonine protein kinase n=1 Tax=Cuscuta australis TaxID=267555 RepID=A0A328DUU1_9ASTE|nr:hypothetical protein DM860_011466 [Cuscuta australis]